MTGRPVSSGQQLINLNHSCFEITVLGLAEV